MRVKRRQRGKSRVSSILQQDNRRSVYTSRHDELLVLRGTDFSFFLGQTIKKKELVRKKPYEIRFQVEKIRNDHYKDWKIEI